jgi:DNA ligase-associated metallophosphoesterase
MPVSHASIDLAGERVHLLPERCLYWEREETLIVADVHWGKAAAFRAGGFALPGGTTSDDLARLNRVLTRTGARRLVVLGDLFHAKAGRVAAPTLAAIRRWRAGRAELDMVLVRGNHDRHAGDPPPELGIQVVNPPARFSPFVFRHQPAQDRQGYTLAGHLHPAASLRGRGRQHERLACFLVGPSVTVLPAFGSFTGTCVVESGPSDRVFVVAGEEVIEVARSG